MKRVCVVSGSRAEYGLLRGILENIRRSPTLELQLLVTGTHLSPEFGMTVDTIESDGFSINRKVEMLLSSDTATGVIKSMGIGLIGFADAFSDLKPNLVLVLGDRYEIFTATTAAMISRIPVAHLHGGEITEGALDDAMRHSITKMSKFHFVATDEYRDRVVQLGEHPERVFKVGGLGIDNILNQRFLAREELEASLNFKLKSRNLLVTFHPVTLDCDAGVRQLDEVLAALAELRDTGLVFTMPNSDIGGRALYKKIRVFCADHPHAKAFTSLGSMLYLSCIKHMDGVVGNSSSGLLEVPSFKKGTIDIGNRQFGRVRAASVIHCEATQASICKALTRLFSPEFQSVLASVKNPYGDGGASKKVTELLEQIEDMTPNKVFLDLEKSLSSGLREGLLG